MRDKLSQGKREWFDEHAFLRKYDARPVTQMPRIATQRITGVDERLRIVATLVDSPAYFADSTNSVAIVRASKYSLLYLLGLLNSRLFQWRFKFTSTNNNVGTNELAAMPFREIDFSDPNDQMHHDRMVGLAEGMLRLHKDLAGAKTPNEKESLQRQIAATDEQIDQLVYDLYGLTGDEIKIVEESGKS